MGYAYLGTVTAIVHDEGTLSLLLFYKPCHLGIGVACGRGLALVYVPHHTFQQIARLLLLYDIGHSIHIAHVCVPVAIIAHEHDNVLPRTGIFVFHIGYALVNQYFCLLHIAHGEASHSHVELVGDG